MATTRVTFIGSNSLRKKTSHGPSDRAMTVKELHAVLTKAIEEGNGEAEVCFDAEARSFDAHLINVDGASVEDFMGDGSMKICSLTTRYH